LLVQRKVTKRNDTPERATSPSCPGCADPRRTRSAAWKSTGLPRNLRLTLAPPGARQLAGRKIHASGSNTVSLECSRRGCGTRRALRGPKDQIGECCAKRQRSAPNIVNDAQRFAFARSTHWPYISSTLTHLISNTISEQDTPKACWASCLGNCGGGWTNEHYISDGIFDAASVTAFGLHWCNEKPVQIGLGSAVSKILCKTHNEALSPYDSEAAKLSGFLTANIQDEPLKADVISLNGSLLEKWALKTCINLGFIGALDQGTFARIVPPENLVREVFSDKTPPDGMGLYFVTGTVSNENYKVGLSWNAIRNVGAGGSVVGMTFTFNGVRLVVSVIPVHAEQLIAKMGVVKGVDYSRATTIYRPRNIVLKSNTAGWKQINLQW
jgi:hypothetical protein